jgi:D-alanyl-D-alanine dipeptidase
MENNIQNIENLDYDFINRLRKLGDENNYKEYLEVLNKELESVKILDNGERMLSLKKYLSPEIFTHDLSDLKIEADNERRLYLRKTIVEKLNDGQKKLPKGLHLTIRDAFRPEDVVWKLYDRYMAMLKEREPGISEREADIKIRNIIAMPDDLVPPGHSTGGAVDIVLAGDDGKRLLFEVDEKLISRDIQMVTSFNELPPEILQNRKILFDTLTSVGFQNYFREYWHYSYGDPYWGVRRKDKTAIYGLPSKEIFIE